MKQQFDRTVVRAMVEDFWRTFLALSATGSQAAEDSKARFDDRLQSMSLLMDIEQRELFLKAAEEEKEMIVREYRKNPESLNLRLGINRNSVVQRVYHDSSRPKQGLGEIAVKTAVRASVWNGINSIFRIFR